MERTVPAPGRPSGVDIHDPATVTDVLVLLPPSETKSTGGSPTPLDVDALSFPMLRDGRNRLLDRLIDLSSRPEQARAALGVPASKDAEVAENLRLRSGPTVAALVRYTGVLYDALAVPSMTRTERSRADARLAVTSAAFGLLRADDLIPFYRCSAGSQLPGLPTTAAHWRPAFDALGAALTDRPVIDLRSGAYAAFGAIPGAVTVRVVTENAAGMRQVVSHFSKHAKGLLARALAVTRADVLDIAGVVRVARRAGMTVERNGPASLVIVT